MPLLGVQAADGGGLLCWRRARLLCWLVSYNLTLGLPFPWCLVLDLLVVPIGGCLC